MSYTQAEVDKMMAEKEGQAKKSMTPTMSYFAVRALQEKIGAIKDKAENERRRLSVEEWNLIGEMQDEIFALGEKFGHDKPASPPETLQGPSFQPDSATQEPMGGPAKDRTYRGMFLQQKGRTRLDMAGWSSSGEFLDVLNSGRHDPRLIRATHAESVPSQGGFSVPEQMAAEWLDSSLPTEIIRSRATVWPMTSETRKVPGWDDFDQSAGSYFGGLKMQFLGEAQAGTYQSAKLRSITLSAKKGAIFTQSSAELMADGLGFADQLGIALRGAMSMGFDNAFLNGTGAGEPLGIRNATSLVQVEAEGGQGSGTILYQNLAKMWARLWAPCRSRSVWIANDAAIPELLTVSIPVGLEGTYVPLLKETSGKFFIFGREVLFSPCMPTVGSENDIILVDLSQYAVGLRKELSIDKSIHVGFQQDLDTWRIICRFDGMPTWSSAVTPDNGPTQSWCVGLEAR